MAVDYLSYTRKGLLPAPKDDDDSFVKRSVKTICLSELLRERISKRDVRLEKILSGTADMFHLNTFHGIACKEIYDKLGMYPIHFVGLHIDITKVMRKDTNERKRSSLLGICEPLNVDGFEVPYYAVSDSYEHPAMVSVHELYHCIMRTQDVRMPFPSVKFRIERMIEEFRGDLLMAGEDISVDEKLDLLRRNQDKIMKMAAKEEIRMGHGIELLLNRPLVRRSIYMKYQQNYKQSMYSDTNLTLKMLAAVGSLAVGLVNPILTANILAQLFLTAAGYATGGFTLGSAVQGLYSNYKVTKANKDIIHFMANTRESLNKDFGMKGANFIAYTLYHPEIKEMAGHSSAKDYLHRKGTTRSKALLEHAMAL
ncbi:MAG: hypothetical protein AABY09_03995 [Nanoarchaeota archaeon]